MFSYINLVNLIIYFEVFIMAQIFASTLPKRNHYVLRLVGSATLGGALAYLFPLLPIENFWLKWLYSIFMYTFLLGEALCTVVVCVKTKINGYLFCAVGGYGLHHLCGTIDALIRPLLFKGFFKFTDPLYSMYHFGIVILVYAFIIWYFFRNAKIAQIMNKKRAVVLASVIVILNIVISSLGMFIGSSDVSPISIVDIYNFISSGLAIFILFGMLEQEYLEREIEIINDLYKENIHQYEISKVTMASLHDLKHRINAVMDGKVDLSEREKKDINDKIFVFDAMAKTGNETLDIILTQKMMLCNQYDIEFGCVVDGKLLSFMDIYDLYSLFGNAISNAIEAVCREQEGEARLISLMVKGTGSYVSIHLENTFGGKIVMTDGLPETNKEDKMSHGFGVKSMYNITDKYDGAMTITIEGNLFILDILFPLKQQ